MREFVRNAQPHLQARVTAYSVTLLLHDALTGPQLEAVRTDLAEALRDIDADALDRKAYRKSEARTRAFHRLEGLLAAKREQSHLLADPAAAGAVGAYFRMFDGELYTLLAYSVMSNHAHVLFDLDPQLRGDPDPATMEWPVDRLVGRLKGGSAYAANHVLGRSGELWMRGYYDRYVRSPVHLDFEYRYILNNPVKAGLVASHTNHVATWGRPDVVGEWS